MGVENRRLEMLFVESSKKGKGAGRKLVEYGIEKYRMDNLTVNEQNPQAVGFTNTSASRHINAPPSTNNTARTR